MLWLGRFVSARVIRQRGAFHVYAARDSTTAAPVTVVVPAPELVASGDARACLARLARAHAAVSAPGLPPLVAEGAHDGVCFVALACDAVLDGEAAIERVAQSRERVRYEEAMSIVVRLGLMVAAAHDAGHVFGALSWANVLVTRDGGLCLFGLGHNVITFDERGAPSGAPSVFMAPEVSTGAALTPGADVCALVLLLRSVLSFAALPAAVEQAFRFEDASAPMTSLVGWVNANVVFAAPDRRASMRAYCEVSARELEVLGCVPDEDAITRRLAELVAPDVSKAELPLTLGPEGAWVGTPSGEVFALRAGPLRRLALHLARARRATPGLSQGVDALLEAGWPGENPQREAGLNRVYVALSTLRKLGLRDVLERDEQGYRITPSVEVHFETPAR